MTTLTLLPSILLSGYIAPRETLPGALLLLSNILPVTYFIQILRGIIVRGTGLLDLLPNVFYLSLITIVPDHAGHPALPQNHLSPVPFLR